MPAFGKQFENLKRSSQRLRLGIERLREDARKLKAEYEAQEGVCSSSRAARVRMVGKNVRAIKIDER